METITLKEYGSSFSTRSLAQQITKDFELVDNELCINFKGVTFVTPSFCHELLQTFLAEGVDVKITEASEDIRFQIIKAKMSMSLQRN